MVGPCHGEFYSLPPFCKGFCLEKIMEIADLMIAKIGCPYALAIYSYTKLNGGSVPESDCIEEFSLTPDQYKEGIKRLMQIGEIERILVVK